MGLISTGPFPYLAPDDTLHFTIAVVCGADSLGLLENSKVAQVAYDDGFSIPSGPPSPRLQTEYAADTLVLTWVPGDSLASTIRSDLRAAQRPRGRRRAPHQPHHRKPDFQGYRIYRFQGETFSGDPYEEANLIAEFDIVDGVGFDTGLPPLGADGLRRFTDDSLLDGFPYWYSVISYSAPDLDEGLPAFESGSTRTPCCCIRGVGDAVGRGRRRRRLPESLSRGIALRRTARRARARA